MPRLYPNGRRLQVNLALDVDAYSILEQLAPSKRAYGHVLSQLLRDRAEANETPSLRARIEKLEQEMQMK